MARYDRHSPATLACVTLSQKTPSRVTTRRLRGWGVGSWHPRTPDQKPEDDRQFPKIKNHRELANKFRVLWQKQGGEGTGQIAEARNYQQNAQDPGDETRSHDKHPERKQP